MTSVIVLGAGALGAAYASRFYDMDPASIALVASGERAERLKADGLVVNGTRYMISVRTPDDPAAPADLVIVALKHPQLADALPDLAPCVSEQTVIISVMNGLDSETIIGAMYGLDKVLYTVAVGIDAQHSGNTITFSKIGTLFFGEADNTTLTDRVRRIQAMFDRAGIPHTTPADMIRTLWWKFMINVGINQASAILRAPYGLFQTSPHAQVIMEAAMSEVITLAQMEHVNLSNEAIDEWYPVLNTLHPEGKTSMLQDIDAGRATEVDIFAGKVVELGHRHGVPTPANMLLLHAIKALEQIAAKKS